MFNDLLMSNEGLDDVTSLDEFRIVVDAMLVGSCKYREVSNELLSADCKTRKPIYCSNIG